MSAKSRFNGLALIYSLLMIGGLSLVFIMAVTMGMEREWPVDKVVWLLVGLIITVFSVSAIIKLNNEEIKRSTEVSKTKHQKFTAQWTVGYDLWHRFVHWEFQEAQKDASVGAVALAVLFGLIAFLIAIPNQPWTISLLVTVIVALIAAGTTLLGIKIQARRKFDRMKDIDNPQIQFTEDRVFINGEMILLNGIGIRMNSLVAQKVKQMNVLTFSVRQGYSSGNKGVRKYMFPFTEVEEVLIARLKDQFKDLITSPFDNDKAGNEQV